MTDRTPQAASKWTRRSGCVDTVTEIPTINGKPNVSFETAYPGTDLWSCGIADVDHFLATRTEASR
jgi:hypothetical protein